MPPPTAVSIDGNSYELTPEFLSHVLATAVEGACSYWAEISTESVDDADAGGTRDFDVSDYTEDGDDDDDDDDEPFYTSASFVVPEDASQGGTLDLQGVADAIERIASGEVDIPPAIREIIVHAVQDADATDIDAEAADCIVQIGLFDEIVYS